MPLPQSAAPRVFLHVGLPKTGTTHLQERLWANRATAARSGLLFPGRSPHDHFHAAVHLQPDRYVDWVDPHGADAWARMREQVRGWRGTAVVSHELFSSALPQHAARFLEELSFAEVHVVATARDLARQVPSVWQENVKNQHTTSFAEFVDQITTSDPNRHQDPFWEFQDLRRILRTWAAELPPERVHVVTVPPRGASGDELWHRFVSLLGADPAALDLPAASGNESLGAAQVELVRRINERVRGDIAWDRYEHAVKGRLVAEILARTRSGPLPTLPPDIRRWMSDLTREWIDEFTAAGYDVVGDLAELIPTEPTTEAEANAGLEDHQVLDAAVDALAALLRTSPLDGATSTQRMKRSLRAQQRRVAGLPRRIRAKVERP